MPLSSVICYSNIWRKQWKRVRKLHFFSQHFGSYWTRMAPDSHYLCISFIGLTLLTNFAETGHPHFQRELSCDPKMKVYKSTFYQKLFEKNFEVVMVKTKNNGVKHHYLSPTSNIHQQFWLAFYDSKFVLQRN